MNSEGSLVSASGLYELDHFLCSYIIVEVSDIPPLY